jgi:hypothetical protein
MKVSELIEILEEMDPDANVLIMSQENWPFENAVYGVTVREEFLGEDAEEDGDDADESSGAPSDVFIVEGSQLRYGSKSAWRVAYRG